MVLLNVTLLLLSIIIVSYNVKPLLEQCLLTAQKAAQQLKGSSEIIVIDNNSLDQSAGFVEKNFPSVKLLANSNNPGFAKACNQGIKVALGKYLLFLNPDTLVPENCFAGCISFFENHPEAGAVGVRMVDEKGRYLKESKRGFPGAAASFYKLFGLTAMLPTSKKFSGYYLGHLDPEKVQQVDVLSGAFMMIPREVLNNSGNFDESFFMYGEDIDLSYRITQAGYTNYYLGTHTITHLKGKSSPSDYSQIRIFYKAMNIFVKKHFRKGKSILLFGIWTRKWMAYIGHFIGNFFNPG